MTRICPLFLGAALLFAGSLSAQSLYIPRNVKQAMARGTRSADGRPGPRYWQNHGRYDIRVTAMPPDRMIRGHAAITYINDSPDTLPRLVLRLVLNFHRPDAIHYGGMDSTLTTPGLQVDRLAINGTPRPWPDPGGRTWQPLTLPAPLLPGDSVKLDIAWHNLIARRSGREGMIDSTTYYLAYFYPRVSVYDDYNGWDQLDFTGYQEFYNDFNDYHLEVTVPRNYIVWATGSLLNPEAVLRPGAAARLRRSMTADSVIRVATAADLAARRVTAPHAENTWIWEATQVPDVAVAISDHYNWDAGSVVVDPSTGRRASVQAAYNDTAADFHHAVAIGRDALGWFSREWPGVPYPYPKMTMVQGYADMEYPMMINDATTDDLAFSRLVANHEIAHTYFPFYMGINESRYAFMDEGWATTFEWLIGRTQRPPEEADAFYKRFRVNRWIQDPSQEQDVPIITPANIERGVAYGSNAYGKPSLAYIALKDMLGDDLFRKCLHAYMERWHGKHPTPWDFFHTFSDVSGQDLNWFWMNWFMSNGYNDLTLDTVRRTTAGYAVKLRNTGGFAIPFDLVLEFTDGSTQKLHQSPAIWKEDQHGATVQVRTTKTLRRVRADNGIFMDANESDNSLTP